MRSNGSKSTCARKRAYTKNEAKSVAKNRNKGKSDEFVPTDAFECRRCGWWHVGRKLARGASR